MTVLQSLLSTFRRSRSSARKSQRKAQINQHSSSEALEPRLLLTNPDPFSSLPGAPVTVYLDFDGHTEGDADWVTRRRDGNSGSIVVPAFSADGDTSAFSQDDRDRIEEIYERVAEDFRPFNINVTTVEPAAFNNARDLLISVGGDGDWSINAANNEVAARAVAISGSFGDARLPQTAFVNQNAHNGLGGNYQQNIAASVSEAVARSMGLEIHESSSGVRLEGDATTAPLLGDGIIGDDTVGLNAERDIWVNARGTISANQDDLVVLTGNPNVSFRVDDHGNLDSSATGLAIGLGTETVTGVISENSDVDVFSFSTAATLATINVDTLDLRPRFGASITPGSNLDPILTLRDAAGNEIASVDGGGLSSTITQSLTAGTYFIEVSNGGAYGNLGEYTVTIDGVDTLPPFANPISLNSNPGAPVTFYLGFAGGNLPASSPLLIGRTDTGNGPIALPAYDTDGNVSVFSAAEEAEIEEIWARVAEDFRPFNINVTTVNPGNFADRQAAQVLIGGDGTFSPASGFSAPLNAFSDSALPNLGLAFSTAIASGNSTDAQHIAFQASAAFGTMLGLEEHSEWFFGVNLGPDPGTTEVGPIMGAPLNSLRDVWVNDSGPVAQGIFQDDLAIITSAANGITYQADDHLDTIPGATLIDIVAGDEQLTGVIATNDDVDVFRFNTLAATATISVKGLDLTDPATGITNPGSNLDPVLRLLDASGNELAIDDVPVTLVTGAAGLTAQITQVLPAGTYYIEVSNRSEYGNLGEYTVVVQGVDENPVTIDISPDTFSETDGLQVGIGTVTRPAGQLFGPAIDVELASSDTLEVIVPSMVTIPSGATSVNFDVTIVDDTRLDGDQRVGITAAVAGVVHSETFVTVTDVESIIVDVIPDTISENAGTVTLEVSRSNTDVDAPNHWVVANNELREYTPDGTLVGAPIPVEWPGASPRPASQDAHDLIVLQNGRVAVYNGTTDASLSIYNPSGGTWQHFGPVSGLSGTPSDLTAGGIASLGDYVFLTDLETTPGDSHGMVRINTVTGDVTRFGEGTVGARLFAMELSSFSSTRILEFSATDGSLINTINLPQIAGGFTQYRANAIAFDGTDLWVLPTTFVNGSEVLIKIDPDTGALLETHSLLSLQNTALDGLTIMNGLLYVVDNIGNFGSLGLEIERYDPTNRLPVGGIIAPEQANAIFVNNYIGAIPTADRLLLTSNSSDVIYEVDPSNGFVTSSFSTARPLQNGSFFDGPGITSVSDVTFGSTTYNELIYVASSINQIDVYTRSGTQIDTNPATPAIDSITTSVPFFGDLSGGDIPGVSAADLRFRDVTIGLDGLLYGLLDSGDEISVHDPESLLRVRGINLDQVVGTIAVGDDSGIYAGDSNGNIVVFDFNGTTQMVRSSDLGVIVDIEVNVGQEVLIGDAAGAILLTNQTAIATGDLTGLQPLENTGDASFVTFGRHPTRSTGDVIVTLTSDDVSELQVPVTVTIPVGEQKVTVQIPVVDDDERDGPQTVTVTGSSSDYVTGVEVVTVNDYETVGVSVIPDAVPEDSGILEGQVIVSRSDVDGPLDFVSSLNIAQTTATPIIDNDVTISQIVVPTQISLITDVNVTLTIQHEAIPDLDVFLISPIGTRVELFTDLSSNESNLTNTTLDDEAAVRIVDATAPFTGRFNPEQQLANFDGEKIAGTWTLEIIDDSSSDAGILVDWSLAFETIGLSAITVTLGSDKPDEATVPVTVTIPANQAVVTLPLEVFDDNEIDGTQTVVISVDPNTLAAVPGLPFIPVNDTVDITDAELLAISVDKTVVSEGAGAEAIVGTLTRLSSVGDLTVNVSSSDATELSTPATVVIPDGELSASFFISAVNDLDFDGDQFVTVDASASGFLSVSSEVITVEDQEPRLQLSTLTPTVAEDAGTITFTITRRDANDLSVAQRVLLTSSDTTELRVPTTVIIPPGEVSTSFVATVVEDTELDGTQPVTITATDFNTATPGIDGTSFDVNIEDAEFVSITVPAGQDSVLENAGAGAVTVTVSVSSVGHTAPIVVALSNSDQTELSIPDSVVIPVDSNSTTFLLDVLNDPKIDRDQLATITGSVAGYRDGVLDITVRDHEPPILVGPAGNTVDPTPVFAWAAVDGATRYDLWVNDVSRNINQLFRRDFRRGEESFSEPIFKETFETAGGYDETGWTATNSEVDDLAIDEEGNFSAHLNGNPDGGDFLTSRDIDLSGELGVQLTYSFQRTGTLDSPGPGEDLVLQYRNADGEWIQLERQLGVEPDMTFFQTSVITLPATALHSTFAFRFMTSGDPTVEDAGDTVDDWFVDDITIAGYQTFEPAQELGVGLYRFWVRAYDDLEQPGVWSSDRTFVVRTPPVFTSPVQTVTIAETTFPQISWTSVVDTDRYDLWINNITTGETQVVRETDLQTTSFASSTANLPGGTYRAWVRAFAPDLNLDDDAPGIAGNWSSSIVFTVLSTPQNIAPSGATFDRTPEIRWDAVEGATNYDVWVTHRRAPGDSPIVLRDRFVSGTSRTPETDLEPGNYVVWVRAVADDGSRSQWSDAVTFTIGGRPTITAPSEGAPTSGTPIITWNGIEQSEFYQVWINNSAGERVVYETNVQATSLALTEVLPADSYRVWVRAISEMGEESFWSNPVSFTVITAAIDTTAPLEFDSNNQSLLTRVEIAQPEFEATSVTSNSLVIEQTPVVAQEDLASTAERRPADEKSTPVEEILDMEVAVDSVMAEWGGADWWNTEASDDQPEDSKMAAAALGIIAAGTSVKSARRRRGTKR